MRPTSSPWVPFSTAVSVLGWLAFAAPTMAQSSGSADPSWNTPQVVSLLERAQTVRADQQVDSAFRSYQSRAEAFVYFYIDRPDEEERTLIKADQVALDVFWKAPDLTRQRIVGRRDEAALPTNIKYHLDHLMVVQDEFGDVIRLGDGDEVEAVPHPVGPGGRAHYDYRMGDSLTISFGGAREPVRVYEVLVRPKDASLPGFIGSVYIDRESASIVRMSFTFTASSYVDPYLDYIRISLDNALWMNRWWLPFRQELEVRREMPVIDFLAGSVIRGRFEIREYDFNMEMADEFFDGPAITAVSPEQQLAFDFEDGLYSDLDDRGLAPTSEIESIEERVREIGMASALGGLNPLRLHWGSFSEGLRYNRSEGWVVGLGTSFDLGDTTLRGLGARAFGPGEFQGEFTASRRLSNGRAWLRAMGNRSADLGPTSAPPGLINTISSLGGEDYTDLHRTSGFALGWEGSFGDQSLWMEVRTQDESNRFAEAGGPAEFRQTLRIAPGRRLDLHLGAEWQSEWGGSLRASAEIGSFDPANGVDVGRLTLGALEVDGRWETGPFSDGPKSNIRLRAGKRFGELLTQDAYYLGGRGSLPGHDYRDRSGDRFVLLQGEIGTPVELPWLSVHAIGALGWTDGGGDAMDFSPDRIRVVSPADGWRASLGAGVDLLWEVVRLDVMRGLKGGRWEAVLSVRPDLAGWM